MVNFTTNLMPKSGSFALIALPLRGEHHATRPESESRGTLWSRARGRLHDGYPGARSAPAHAASPRSQPEPQYGRTCLRLSRLAFGRLRPATLEGAGVPRHP